MVVNKYRRATKYKFQLYEKQKLYLETLYADEKVNCLGNEEDVFAKFKYIFNDVKRGKFMIQNGSRLSGVHACQSVPFVIKYLLAARASKCSSYDTPFAKRAESQSMH